MSTPIFIFIFLKIEEGKNPKRVSLDIKKNSNSLRGTNPYRRPYSEIYGG